MARILALDYGLKRTGIAVTDPLQIIATGLETVPTDKLFTFLEQYLKNEEVETIVVGMPKRLDERDTHASAPVRTLISALAKKFPEINLVEEDERYTSKMAVNAMIEGGMKKKNRRKKENIDKISAVLILQSYLESR